MFVVLILRCNTKNFWKLFSIDNHISESNFWKTGFTNRNRNPLGLKFALGVVYRFRVFKNLLSKPKCLRWFASSLVIIKIVCGVSIPALLYELTEFKKKTGWILNDWNTIYNFGWLSLQTCWKMTFVNRIA